MLHRKHNVPPPVFSAPHGPNVAIRSSERRAHTTRQIRGAIPPSQRNITANPHRTPMHHHHPAPLPHTSHIPPNPTQPNPTHIHIHTPSSPPQPNLRAGTLARSTIYVPDPYLSTPLSQFHHIYLIHLIHTSHHAELPVLLYTLLIRRERAFGC
jgi:hypothetical protein